MDNKKCPHCGNPIQRVFDLVGMYTCTCGTPIRFEEDDCKTCRILPKGRAND